MSGFSRAGRGRLTEAPNHDATPAGPALGGVSLKPVTVPVLVSAVANLIGGYAWLTTCFGIVLTAPMLVLCVFELIYFATAAQMTRGQLMGRGRAIGICEIVVGVFNLVSLVCGVVVLVHLGRMRPAAG